jgi:spore coat polysaccharide biosynthesis predicted glycosyltransferase SpsG
LQSILFRVDAGDEIGLGHFYRSISLAKALKDEGYIIGFTFKKSKFWLEQLLGDFPFQTYPISEDEWEDEYAILKANTQFKIFFVDGFINYGEALIKKIKKMSVKVIFYQNLTASKSLADVFILPSIHQDKSFFEDFDATTRIFQGLKYFTFNASIKSLNIKKAPNKLNKIAVIAGGSDPKDTLKAIYNLLSDDLIEGLDFTFYYGVNYLFKNEIPTKTHTNVSWTRYDPKGTLENDMLISAFGVSTYEFLALGMPILSYGHQKQNAASAQYFAENTGALISLGLIDDLTSDGLLTAINQIRKDPIISRRMVEKAKELIDLQGLDRVKEIIKNV